MGEIKQLPTGHAPNGKFTRGNIVGRKAAAANRARGKKLIQAIEGLYEAPPTELHYLVALHGLKDLLREALGREPTIEDIPVFDENQQLQIWIFDVYAKHGSSDHAKELLDRIAPKPSRVTLDATVHPRPPMAAVGDGSDSAAESYYKRLVGDDAS